MVHTVARTGLLIALLSWGVSACAKAGRPGAPAGAAAAASVQRAWWRAFVLADTATLHALSTPQVRFIASTGHSFDRSGTLAESASSTTGARLVLDWSEEQVVPLRGEQTVLVTARITETEGRTVNHYRFTGVLERSSFTDGGWKVASAQRTREIRFTPRIASAHAGDIGAYAGRYRVPSGAAIVVAVQDSALTLTDPNGAVLRLEPVAPAVFESTRLSGSNGIVRFTFARDAQGRVAALSRLIQGGIVTFPRESSP